MAVRNPLAFASEPLICREHDLKGRERCDGTTGARSIEVRPRPRCSPGATSPGSSTDEPTRSTASAMTRGLESGGTASPSSSASKKPTDGADVGGHDWDAAESGLDRVRRAFPQFDS